MKKLKKYFVIALLLVGAMYSLTNCTKHDQIINPNATVTPPIVVAGPGDTLFCVKTSVAPAFVLAGVAWSGPDASWANAPKTTETVVVPDVEGDLTNFSGYIGNSNTEIG